MHKAEGSSSNAQPHDYCREVEAYLCRKNDGHLIRIVGPAFDLVCGWAEQGVPLAVARRGIDRSFERYYAKGPRRRPLRVEFCEADVLDAFDDWRRAVGVSVDADEEARPGRRESLPEHLERAAARLAALREVPGLGAAAMAAHREVDAAREGARGLRGGARATLLARLAELDADLLAAARAHLHESDLAALRREAEDELLPFRARMPAASYEASLQACLDRLVREKTRIPTLTLE